MGEFGDLDIIDWDGVSVIIFLVFVEMLDDVFSLINVSLVVVIVFYNVDWLGIIFIDIFGVIGNFIVVNGGDGLMIVDKFNVVVNVVVDLVSSGGLGF